MRGLKVLFLAIFTFATLAGSFAATEEVTPSVSVSSKNEKYRLTVGGYVQMRAAYDFGGSIDNLDFIPSLIPVPGSYDSQRRFVLDGTTSRIVVKGYTMSEKLGEVELCLNADFRGGATSSYMPRVRMAYIKAAGFLIGRDYTSFCDMGSAAPTIDFQSTIASPYIYTTQISYVQGLAEGRVNLGAAVEYAPYNYATLNSDYALMDKYLPAIPVYAQFNWGEQLDSHVRVSALYKNISLYDLAKEENLAINGWATRFSGTCALGNFARFNFSATCGEGVTEYIQDLYGMGLDLYMSDVTGRPTPTFMGGWQATMIFYLCDNTMLSGGYSGVYVDGDTTRFAGDEYKSGEYAFATLYHNLSPRLQLGAEYLWGSRRNFDGAFNDANRINAIVQYNF